jgi:hypothetical protein
MADRPALFEISYPCINRQADNNSLDEVVPRRVFAELIDQPVGLFFINERDHT